MARLEEGCDGAGAVRALPERYRTRLQRTNVVGRRSEETWRRERAIRSFPTETPAERLSGAVLLDLDEPG